MLKSQKADLVRDIRDRFARMSSAVFLDYQGMTVAEVSALRDVFRERGIDYRVVKNTLVRQALGNEPWVAELDPALRGMTAVAWSFEEPSAAARVVREFRKGEREAQDQGGTARGHGPQSRGGRDPAGHLAQQGRGPRHAARDPAGSRPALRHVAQRARAQRGGRAGRPPTRARKRLAPPAAFGITHSSHPESKSSARREVQGASEQWLKSPVSRSSTTFPTSP